MLETNGGSRQPTILIVDDRCVVRALLRSYVQVNFPGYAVSEALNGARAMQQCAELGPQLVLMDIVLPDANGIELTASIRSGMPETAVIIVSYLDNRIYAEKALAAGAHAFVHKDRLLSELVPAMARTLGTTPVSNSRQS